ncbi:hypothetical protein NQ176_g9330 [Zarea fungicola]|uniref:Uncharacterized protein n=1 Tax=Zarea fungicola TaxID=93591 RepID=A0ACC1MP64_9HYPO|nr:hypothetical protein NQ176_g9330 [Lecanicillium fungicola]
MPAMIAFQDDVADRTAGFSVEQLEQLNREMMDKIWQTRNEWNRLNVYYSVKGVFDNMISDIESLHKASIGGGSP